MREEEEWRNLGGCGGYGGGGGGFGLVIENDEFGM